jgi:hypothetical protein
MHKIKNCMSKGHNNWADGVVYSSGPPITRGDRALHSASMLLGLVLLFPSAIGIYKHHELERKLREKTEYESVARGIETIHSLKYQIRDLGYQFSKEDEIKESWKLQDQMTKNPATLFPVLYNLGLRVISEKEGKVYPEITKTGFTRNQVANIFSF